MDLSGIVAELGWEAEVDGESDEPPLNDDAAQRLTCRRFRSRTGPERCYGAAGRVTAHVVWAQSKRYQDAKDQDAEGNESKFNVSEGHRLQVLRMDTSTGWVQIRTKGLGNLAPSKVGWLPKYGLILEGCRCDICEEFRKRELVGCDPTAAGELMALLGTGGFSMPAFWPDEVLNTAPVHALVAAVTVALSVGVVRQGPSRGVAILGTAAAYLGVDLASTAYHVALDYGVFAGDAMTNDLVTDYHHMVPLNYVLFDPWELLASSYVVVFPGTLLQFLPWLGLRHVGAPAAAKGFMASYCAAFWAIGLTVGFVHLAAHRRNNGLHLPAFVRALQDLRVILHPDVHRQHHELYVDNYSLFSGITHPVTNRFVWLARRLGVLGPPVERELGKSWVSGLLQPSHSGDFGRPERAA